MTPPLPRDMQMAILTDGVRWVLPRRQMSGGRAAGVVVLVIGLVGTVFMTCWMGLPLSSAIGHIRSGQHFGWLLVAFALLGLPGLIPALGLTAFGLALLNGRSHAEVEIRGGKLRAIERAGLLRWTWKRPVERIERLRVGKTFEVQGHQPRELPAGLRLTGELCTLYVEGPSLKTLRTAPGYDRALLNELAGALAEHMDSGGRARLFDDAPPAVEVVQSPAETAADGSDGPASAPPPVQPIHSRVLVDRRPDGLTLTVPPKGVWRGSKGLFFFSLLWNGILAVITGSMVLSALGFGSPPAQHSTQRDMLVGMGVLGLFGVIGLGLLLAALNMGRRRAIIDVVGHTLLISQQTLFRTRQREWTADQIDRIEVGPSGFEVNDVPVRELQVHPVQGKKFGCLSQLENDELHWLAAEISRALGVAPKSSIVPAPLVQHDGQGIPVQPADSRIRVDDLPLGLIITVPPYGFSSGIGGVFVIGLLLSLLTSAVIFSVTVSVLHDGFQPSDQEALVFLAIWTPLFGGGSVACATSGLLMARRRHIISLDRRRLTITRTGPFGQRLFEWPVEEIRKIEVANSNTKIGERTCRQLVVKFQVGKTMNLATGRDDAELAWLAALLDQRLQEMQAVRV